MKAEITLELPKISYTYDQLRQIASDIWQYDFHGDKLESMQLYVKPADRRCYVVANGVPFSFGI